jgi:hypothetical protein
MIHAWERKGERLSMVDFKWRMNEKLEKLWSIYPLDEDIG